MQTIPAFDDIAIERQGFVAVLEIRRPPLNFFDAMLIGHLAEVLEALDADATCRAVVLCASGKAFCAGADFSGGSLGVSGQSGPDMGMIESLYGQALRLFETRKPIVAAVHGAAIGGGLGLALMADFRVSCESARFSANFARLGLHCGFGISVTLPRLVGANPAAMLLYTGRRLTGRQALAIGLADQLVDAHEVRPAAIALAAEIAASAPMAVQDMRATLRVGLADQVRVVLQRELAAQVVHTRHADFAEGVRATAERRLPQFKTPNLT